MKRRLLIALLGILTVAGFVSTYKLAFCAWMCSYHVDQPALAEWQRRFYIQFGATAALGVAWLATGIGLIWGRYGKGARKR